MLFLDAVVFLAPRISSPPFPAQVPICRLLTSPSHPNQSSAPSTNLFFCLQCPIPPYYLSSPPPFLYRGQRSTTRICWVCWPFLFCFAHPNTSTCLVYQK
ncbi:unnamed protein product [Periconia digitata]|uniref:Uncharacterized protein n=1 Tax=Periconia digitata TaxID=1303443 RepID=A0A9W4UQ14_9PLEO|nr:unnamed protein product [Periconia digitata]